MAEIKIKIDCIDNNGIMPKHTILIKKDESILYKDIVNYNEELGYEFYQYLDKLLNFLRVATKGE